MELRYLLKNESKVLGFVAKLY